jgi:rhodanese-related sulfurtransferase
MMSSTVSGLLSPAVESVEDKTHHEDVEKKCHKKKKKEKKEHKKGKKKHKKSKKRAKDEAARDDDNKTPSITDEPTKKKIKSAKKDNISQQQQKQKQQQQQQQPQQKQQDQGDRKLPPVTYPVPGDKKIVQTSALDYAEPTEDTSDHNVTLLLFYQYVEPPWDGEFYQKVLSKMQHLGDSLKLTGRMRVAKEGLNCTLTSSHEGILAFCKALREFNVGEFKDTEFKLTADLPQQQAFPSLKVMPVAELVHYGLDGEKAPPIQYTGVHLQPEDYHEKLAQEDTVVIDVRNHYEAAIGRFAAPNSKWLDPKMRKSTEFPVWLDKEETKQELKGKNVLMYCTGGVRCERASALLKYKMEVSRFHYCFVFSFDNEVSHTLLYYTRRILKSKIWAFKECISCKGASISILSSFRMVGIGKAKTIRLISGLHTLQLKRTLPQRKKSRRTSWESAKPVRNLGTCIEVNDDVLHVAYRV